MKSRKFDRFFMKELPGYVRFTVIALAIALVVMGMMAAQMLLMPLVWAVMLTLMLLPVAEWWERRFKRRVLASGITVLMAVAVGAGVLLLLGTQAIGLADDSPVIAEKLTVTVNSLRYFVDEQLGLPFAEQPEAFKAELMSGAEGIALQLSKYVQRTMTTVALMVVVPIYVFFLLSYRELFVGFVGKLTTVKNKAHTVHTITSASKIVQGYLIGASIEMLIVSVMVSILFLVLGIKHALFFGVFVALLNVIPYVGVFIGSTVSVIYAYFTTDIWYIPVLVFVFLWVIQIIDNNFIVPVVVGQKIRLNPLAILLVVVLGGLIWGVSGMVLFIPILGMIKVILDDSEFLQPYGYLLGDKESSIAP